MRIAILKSTGRIIEMQSDASEGTLEKNARANGYAADDVTEREITPSEYKVLQAAQDAADHAARPVSETVTAAELFAALKAKGDLTDEDIAASRTQLGGAR